jgi:hypothetical protein
MSPSTSYSETRQLASEIKFLLDPSQAAAVTAWARGNMSPDPNAGGESGDTYRTTSLYFDTPCFHVFHRIGSFARSKYRIRRYGEASGAFLERKLKTGNLVCKRRSIIGALELDRLVASRAEQHWDGYWFHRRLIARQLRPVCQISYLRTARVSQSSTGPVRLTLDQDIIGLPAGALRFDDPYDGIPLLPGRFILELKYIAALPALFKGVIEEFSLIPLTVSKYRLAAGALRLAHD